MTLLVVKVLLGFVAASTCVVATWRMVNRKSGRIGPARS